jgi:hypothetical protein
MPDHQLIVLLPEVRHDGERTTVVFRHRGGDGDGGFHVTIDTSLDPEPMMLGAAAAAFYLLPALRMGKQLVLEAPVPPGMRESLAMLQEVHGTWYPDHYREAHPVDCHEQTPPSGSPARQGKASFFSGGVDSTHSVLRHRREIDSLIFVIGFDIDVDNKPLAKEVTAAMRAASEDFGIPLRRVETDLRKFSEGLVWWGSHYCGAAMAGVGHLFAPLVRSVVIPGTMTWAAPGPFGTHPLTDEMWSTGTLNFEHDGCDTPRLEKFRFIGGHEEGLRHLRVCWRNPGNAYNCGKCEKCLRAMANLRALGLLGRCPTFPALLDPGDLREMEIHHPLVLPFLEETLVEAAAAGDNGLSEALRALITRYEIDCLAKEPREVLEQLAQSATWREKTVPRFRDEAVAACLANDPGWTRGKLLHALPGDERQTLARQGSEIRWWKRLFRADKKSNQLQNRQIEI